MTDNITLPRAVVEQVREALLSFDNWWDDEADTALTALDAALAEPDAIARAVPRDRGEQMTREDIIRMAREAEDYVDTIYAKGEYHPGWLEVFNVRFAALVAEAEREACKKLAQEHAARYKVNGEFYKLLGENYAPCAATACDHIVHLIEERGE